MPFGQLVVGPPGSGKTTYCAGLQHFYELTGRPVAVINLDPGSDLELPYSCSVNILDLISLESVMEELHLGPNGGLLYCIDYLKENLDWLKEQLQPLVDQGCYLLFDLPGQVELFMMSDSLKDIVLQLTGDYFRNLRLTVVQLVDSHLCCDPPKYISALLLSLAAMLHLELPHVNVLSKIDLLPKYGTLAFNLDFYTEALDLRYLLKYLDDDPLLSAKYRKLSAGLCEVVEDFSLVSFIPLNIEDKESVQAIVALVDKSNGFVFEGLKKYQKDGEAPPEFSYAATIKKSDCEHVLDVQDKYIPVSDFGSG